VVSKRLNGTHKKTYLSAGFYLGFIPEKNEKYISWIYRLFKKINTPQISGKK